jgi:hypothetical protein
MYDELVKRLRDAAKMSEALAVLLPHSEGNATAKLYNEAADAIEELSAYARQMANLKKDGWYLQKTKMMTYGQATMTMPLPEPPKEE